MLFRNHYRSDTPAAPGHRTLQVCSQAAEALHFALQELDDPLLQALDVVSVVPVGGVRRLAVTVRPLSGAVADPDLAARIVERLSAAQGRLRSAVARAVRRKRAPELTFRVAATPGGDR